MFEEQEQNKNYSIWRIQASLFALYGSATCIGPYVGVYLGRYTIANKRDIGTIESISAVANIFLRLTLGFVADRYRDHKLVYLICTLLYLVASTSLLGPIFLPNPGNGTSHAISTQTEEYITTMTTTTTTTTTTHSSTTAEVSSITHIIRESEIANKLRPYNSLGEFGIGEITEKRLVQEVCDDAGSESPHFSLEALQWLYLIATLIIIMELMMKVNMNLGDAFCVDVAMKANSSYSSIRFWGGVGRTLCAFSMIFVNRIEPFLTPALIISAILTSINVIIIAFSPSRNSNFDMSAVAVPNQENNVENLVSRRASQLTTNTQLNLDRIKFKHNKRLGLRKRKLSYCMGDMQLLNLEDLSKGNKFMNPIKTKRVNLSTKFDTREEDKFRNIRRCSLAPLGDSFVIKQFELDNKNLVRHFNHVTKIEPVATISNTNLPVLSDKRQLWPTHPAPLLDDAEEATDIEDDLTQYDDDYQNHPKESDEPGFMIYLRVMLMIGIKNKQLFRFLTLYTVNGLIAAVGWVYLFPYLEIINGSKFAILSGYLLMSRYLSETIFYYLSPKSLFNSINHATSLSIILFFYGIRYSFYPLLGTILPFESIVLIETLRAPTMGWYNCVSNEAALKFALESNKCIPDLIASGHIENNLKTIERLNTGFKATMVVISACFFDGLGFAIGAYIGGLLAQAYGFYTLWLITSAFAITVSLMNLLLEIIIKRRGKSSPTSLELA